MNGPTVLTAADALGWFRIWCERPLMFLVVPADPHDPKVWYARLLLDGFLMARPDDQSFAKFDAWVRRQTSGLGDQWLGEAMLPLQGINGNHSKAIERLLGLILAYGVYTAPAT